VEEGYRIELSRTKKGTPRYFLVKEIKVGGKPVRARKYIGSASFPSVPEIEALRRRFAADLEFKAADSAAKASAKRYTSAYLSEEQMERLERLRYLHRFFAGHLTEAELKVHEEDFEVNYIQGTTAIEGNTLTVMQAYDLLINDIPPQGKSLREINEVQNFRKMMAYRDSYNKKITTNFIKNVHAIIMNNIDNESAGAFRRTDMIGIMGCDLRVAPSTEIENELNEKINNYYNNLEKGCHPFEQAVLFHYSFEMIHPFTDGNGRVGRELFNYLLMKNRPAYPRLLFLGKDRPGYIRALKLGNEEKYPEMISFFVDLIINQRLDAIEKNLRSLLKA
jgi:Fic family protein